LALGFAVLCVLRCGPPASLHFSIFELQFANGQQPKANSFLQVKKVENMLFQPSKIRPKTR
jgi:hypothetical protein